MFKMRHLYYYIPPCPVCGSRRTGRYVRRPFSGAGYMMEKSLKAGELIRFRSKEPEKNAYCEKCGHEWPCLVETKFLTKEEMLDEQEARGTIEPYEQIQERKQMQNFESRGFLGRLFGKPGPSKYMPMQPDPYDPGMMQIQERPTERRKMQIVDKRPQKTVEIHFLDEDMIRWFMSVSDANQY